MNPSRPNNRGVYIGRVTEQLPGGRTGIRLKRSLRVGDGIEVWVRSGRNPAAVVKYLEVNGNRVDEAEPGTVAFLELEGRAFPGDRVFRTHDSVLIKKTQESIAENGPKGKVGIKAEVRAEEGKPLTITFTSREGVSGKASTFSPAVAAEKKPLAPGDVYEKVSRLGNTPFYIENFELNIKDGLMVPFSEINEARRRAALALQMNLLERTRPPAIGREEFIRACETRKKKRTKEASFEPVRTPELAVFAAVLESAEAAIEAGADRVYLLINDASEGKQDWWKRALSLKQSAVARGQQLIPALPRIVGPLDKIPWEQMKDMGWEGVLAGNPGTLLEALHRGFKVFADHPLNTFNPEAARFWMENGAQRVCISPELSLKQLRTWPRNLLARSEMLVHGDLVLMVSAYCPWIGLGLGEPNRCGQVCRSDDFYLIDRRNYRFPIRTDSNCRVYLFNSRTLCLIEELPVLLALGIGTLRIEAWLGNGEATREIVRNYRKALDGLRDGLAVHLESLRENLKGVAPSEFSKIHYYRGVL